MKYRSWMIAAVVAVVALMAGVARADVFNMGGTRNPATGTWTGLASLEFVTVGDPGNAADTAVMQEDGTTGYGSVPYVYQMGKYDVTVGQYVQFLNAVAKTDTYGLYNSYMAANFSTISITQNGNSGNYNYSVVSSYSAAANCPIFDVSWGDAARFCNWLQNKQPTGDEGPGTTETGAYTLNGATSISALMAITRNSGATYFIPSENEWYKAAYYKGGGTNAGYWLYPTKSNIAPINTLPDTGNHANFYDTHGTGNGGYTDPPNYLTPVGAFTLSPGPYGTYDQGGDVWQWDETAVSSSMRRLRGGDWDSGYGSDSMEATSLGWSDPTVGNNVFGFRVASVPFLPGDANRDGTVNGADLDIVLSNYDTTGKTWAQGDFNGDGTVDGIDLNTVLSHYNQSAGATAAVPEPSTLALFGVGAISLLAFAWRRRRRARCLSCAAVAVA